MNEYRTTANNETSNILENEIFQENPISENLQKNGKNEGNIYSYKTKENKFINVMYTNADSLSNKLNETETYASLYKADVILITEYLSKNTSSNFANIYKINGFNSIECNEGRGVGIFYKEHLQVSTHDKINDLYKPSIFINVKTDSKPLNIGLIYRSPNNDACENKKLNKQLAFASKKLKNLILFGDFNHPSIEWEFNYCKRNEDHCDSQFLFEVTKNNLSQLITKPTHFKPKCKPTLIDLISTKNPELISNITHNPPIGKSYQF